MAVDREGVVRVLLRERTRVLASIWSIVRRDNVAERVYEDVSLLALRSRRVMGSEDDLVRWIRVVSEYKAVHAMQQQSEAVEIAAKIELLSCDGELIDESID